MADQVQGDQRVAAMAGANESAVIYSQPFDLWVLLLTFESSVVQK